MSYLGHPACTRAVIEHDLVVLIIKCPRAASDPGAGVAAVTPVASPDGVSAHEGRRLQFKQEERYN